MEHLRAENEASSASAAGELRSPGAVDPGRGLGSGRLSPWSVRLKALLPDWLPWIRQHYRPSTTVEQQLLRIGARQIDRRLQAKKQAQRRRIYGRTKPGCLLKHQIPVKTDSWDVKTPGS